MRTAFSVKLSRCFMFINTLICLNYSAPVESFSSTINRLFTTPYYPLCWEEYKRWAREREKRREGKKIIPDIKDGSSIILEITEPSQRTRLEYKEVWWVKTIGKVSKLNSQGSRDLEIPLKLELNQEDYKDRLYRRTHTNRPLRSGRRDGVILSECV